VLALVAGVYLGMAAKWKLAEETYDVVTAWAEVAGSLLFLFVAFVLARIEAAKAERLRREGHSAPVDVLSEAGRDIREYMAAKEKVGIAGIAEAGAQHLRSRKQRRG